MKVTDPQFAQRFTEELVRLDREVRAGRRRQPELHLDYGMLATVVGQLQLALRHPNNTGKGAQAVRAMLFELIQQIDSEAVRVGLMAGFNPMHDRTCEEETARG